MSTNKEAQPGDRRKLRELPGWSDAVAAACELDSIAACPWAIEAAGALEFPMPVRVERGLVRALAYVFQDYCDTRARRAFREHGLRLLRGGDRG